MPLIHFMTATASTTRPPAISGGKIGDPVANLTGVKITPRMLSSGIGSQAIRQAIGLDGTAIQLYEVYTESHAHTDSGMAVTQMPDIVVGDRIVLDGTTYNVRWAETQSLTTAYGETLIIYMTEDKRA